MRVRKSAAELPNEMGLWNAGGWRSRDGGSLDCLQYFLHRLGVPLVRIIQLLLEPCDLLLHRRHQGRTPAHFGLQLVKHLQSLALLFVAMNI